MAIDIQQPNYSGLVALAGRSAPLNIQPTGALGLQALQEKYANDASLRANALGQAQLQQQGQLGLLANQTQQQALAQQAAQQQRQGLLDQQKMAMQGNQFDQSQALEQQKMGMQNSQFNQDLELRNRILAEQTAKDQMTKLMAESKQKLQEKGAFASYALLAMSNAKTPEEQNQIRAEIIKEAKATGNMTEEEATVAGQMPLSQFQNGLKYKVMQFGQVKEYKDMVDAQKAQNPTAGVNLTVGPDGSIQYTSTATKPNETQAQKDIMFAQDNVDELKQLYKNVPENFFGASAVNQTGTKIREWAQNIPIIGKVVGPSEEAKKSLESYSGLQGTSNMLSMNIIKQLSGVQYSDKQLEFMNQILPQFGPGHVKSEFNGRAQNLLRFFDEIKQNREQLLKKGIPLDSPEYKDQMLNIMQNAAAKVNDNSPLAGHLRSLKNADGSRKYSDQEIADYLKGQ